MQDQLPRKLAAILYADVADYSRLTGEDEEGTHRRLSEYLDLVSELIRRQTGRVVHYAGDAVLAKFDAAIDALSCAVEVQRELAVRNVSLPEHSRVQFRIGLNTGDVIEDRGDIYGDGVNVAARLEALADPGGICISGSIRDIVGSRLDLDYEDLGEREVKNIARPIRVFRVQIEPRGSSPTVMDEPESKAAKSTAQKISFHSTTDNVSIAYSRMGHGPLLVKAGNWINNLEYEVEHLPWNELWRGLAHDFELLRYDQRGNGLSDWEVDDISFEAFVTDLESLADGLGLERFALLGISQGCGVSVAYAARHPERVSHLVLYAGYVKGWRARGDAAEISQGEALATLMEQGWGQENPAFRQVFTTLFMPDGTHDALDAFDELQRISVSPRNAARLHQAFGWFDVSGLLAEVAAPTLVLHCREDARVPFGQGRAFATGIADARFVPLEGRNHILLRSDPALRQLLAEIREFVKR